MPVSFDKLQQQAPELVSLAKKAQFNLSKYGLENHRAKVALAIDFSGSMSQLYKSGQVQALAERVLALGTQLDDDGAIDVFAFDSDADYLGELKTSDYIGGIDRLTKNRYMGTTNYAAVMKKIREHFANGKPGGFFRKATTGPAELPTYVLFLTDGEPDSRNAATKQLVDASREAIFWQFLAIGEGPFDYLRELDESVKGRLIDNANLFEASDVASLNDQALFSAMLAEYPQWLKLAQTNGLLQPS